MTHWLYTKTSLLLFSNREHTYKTLKQDLFYTNKFMFGHVHSFQLNNENDHIQPLIVLQLPPTLFRLVVVNNYIYFPRELKESYVQSIFPS